MSIAAEKTTFFRHVAREGKDGEDSPLPDLKEQSLPETEIMPFVLYFRLHAPINSKQFEGP